MRSIEAKAVVLLAMVMACAEPPEPPRGDADGTSGGGSTDEQADIVSTTEDSDTGTEPICEPIQDDHVVCDGECVLLNWSDEHCGQCNHACNPYNIDGHCQYGRCTAVRGECLNAASGFATCNEYCASIGEVCGSGATEYEDHPCYGRVFLYSNEECKFSGSGYNVPDGPAAACDWVIPFGEQIYPGFTPNGVRCCCTQHGGE